MKFEYTGRHIEVTPALRSHVEEGFAKIEHLFNGDNSKAHIIIEVERGKHRSEVVVKWRDQVLTATTNVDDMYKSLSQTISKIGKQALKLKTKTTDKHHKALKVSTAAAKPEEEVKPAPDSPQILDNTDYPVKPMTEDEAVLRLNEEENQFLVFRNAADERVSVIYKRKDGNYGLIQP